MNKSVLTFITDNKKFKNLHINYDPDYDSIIKSIDIVKKFIIRKELIIYGGTAIDYALRLKGDCIYPDEMLQIPDLDFYSPDSVNDAYELADILYNSGFKEARTIGALYIRAMRVDIINNNWIADITYVPPEIFNKLPVLKYEGMKIIHPHFQKIDQHISLSLPFMNPSIGFDIFNRWCKDVSRYNILSKYYPIESAKNMDDPINVEFPIKYLTCCLHGFAAYAAIYKSFEQLKSAVEKCIGKINPQVVKLDKTIIKSELIINKSKKTFSIPTLNKTLELFNIDADGLLKSMDVVNIKHHSAYINLQFDYYVGAELNDQIVKVYSTKNKLINVAETSLDGGVIRFSSIQFLMAWCLSNRQIDIKYSNTYNNYYISLQNMIKCSEILFDDLYLSAKSNKNIKESIDNLAKWNPFYPNINVYGDKNNNYSDVYFRLRNMMDRSLANRDATKLEKIDCIKVPTNYHPHKGNEHASFDYNNKWFKKDGKEIIE